MNILITSIVAGMATAVSWPLAVFILLAGLALGGES